jgi:hypothetical protein
VLIELKDKIETKDPDLQDVFTKYLTCSLTKKLAAEYKKPWTDEHETELQETIAALLGAVKAKRLTAIKLLIVKPSGKRIRYEISVDKVVADRGLQ